MSRRPRQRASSSLRSPILCCVALGMLSGCGGGGQQVIHRAPVPQHEIEQRAEASADRASGKPSGPTNLPGPMQRAMSSYKTALTNAAHRDREMEGLIRRYLGLTREVFHHFRANRPMPPGGPDTYDPMPTWRFQAQQSFEYRLLSARAAMVTQHLRDIAATQQLDLDALLRAKGHGRGQRIALYARIFDCIRQDATARADHGRRYLDHGGGPPPRMAGDDRANLYNNELMMMRKSVTCTTLTAMRRPRALGMR